MEFTSKLCILLMLAGTVVRADETKTATAIPVSQSNYIEFRINVESKKMTLTVKDSHLVEGEWKENPEGKKAELHRDLVFGAAGKLGANGSVEGTFLLYDEATKVATVAFGPKIGEEGFRFDLKMSSNEYNCSGSMSTTTHNITTYKVTCTMRSNNLL